MSKTGRLSILIQTYSMYAAAYDEGSPSNVPEFAGRLLKSAREEEKEAALFKFNDLLWKHARMGDILPWCLLLDGIFDCVATTQDSPNEPLEPNNNLGGDKLVTNLNLPTGRLIVSCLWDTGVPRQPIICVPPGVYRITFLRNFEIEQSHIFLKSETEYQAAAAPDWTLLLSRVPERKTRG